jgi:hypothetical protein
LFQEIIANTLGLDMGMYHHTANSLHVYEKHFNLLEEIVALKQVEFSVPYIYKDMVPLSTVFHQLRYLDVDSSVDHDVFGVFWFILRQYVLHKHGRKLDTCPDEFQWTQQFFSHWKQPVAVN